MRTFLTIFLIFLTLTGAATLMINVFNIEFGNQDYWENHGFGLLIFLAIFPRLTLLLSSIPFGGFLWWLGFFFTPRLLIAFLATISYWNTNPILVIFSWLFAISGESGEKTYVRKYYIVKRYPAKTFEAEYTIEN